MSDEATLKKNLKQALDAKGYSMASVSKRSGVGITYLKDIMAGRIKNPSLFKVQNIAQALETTIEALLGSEDATRYEPINFDLLQAVTENRLESFLNEGNNLDAKGLAEAITIGYNVALNYPEKVQDEGIKQVLIQKNTHKSQTKRGGKQISKI